MIATAPAQESQEKSKPAGNPASAAALGEAAAILRDLQELSAAVERETTTGQAAIPAALGTEELLRRMGRPERRVGTPQVDSKAVDELVAKTLEAEKVAPAKTVGDEEFIRRVTLDVLGKLPTPAEVQSFIREKDSKKREKLIERLLGSSDYATNWARYWRDVIKYRATDERLQIVNYPKLEEWLAEQFRENRPWDVIAGEMISATGNNNENGAAVFASAHMGTAVEFAGEVSRVFLGVQIQCAQCHDHPTDSWKREQFHEFAAFFAGVNVRPNRRGPMPEPGGTVVARPRVRYTMPDLEDPAKSIPVEPKFFLASSESPVPANLSVEQRRLLAASYVTGQDNPWFAKAFVNRIWYALVGEGFYNPVDDLGPQRQPHAPEVLDAIAGGFAESGYDIQWLFRTILGTRTYQRQFRPVATAAGKTPFAANCASRLRSDQIIDSLAQALDMEVVEGGNLRAVLAGNRANRPNAPRGGGPPRLPRLLINATFGVDPSTPNEEVLGTIPQALYLMNSPEVNRAISARGGVVDKILQEFPDNRAAAEAAYLKILSRRPTRDELETIARYFSQSTNRREAFEDLVWALVNSTEFISRK
jgi:hypothetical protein